MICDFLEVTLQKKKRINKTLNVLFLELNNEEFNHMFVENNNHGLDFR